MPLEISYHWGRLRKLFQTRPEKDTRPALAETAKITAMPHFRCPHTGPPQDWGWTGQQRRCWLYHQLSSSDDTTTVYHWERVRSIEIPQRHKHTEKDKNWVNRKTKEHFPILQTFSLCTVTREKSEATYGILCNNKIFTPKKLYSSPYTKSPNIQFSRYKYYVLSLYCPIHDVQDSIKHGKINNKKKKIQPLVKRQIIQQNQKSMRFKNKKWNQKVTFLKSSVNWKTSI